MQEHKKIIKAFKRHDGEKADNLVRYTATIGAEVLIHNMARENGKQTKVSKRLPRVDI